MKEEIQRLTQELQRLRKDFKREKEKSCALDLTLRSRETEMEENQKNFDQEMRDLVSKLLLLEADFRKEQKEIQSLLNEKDSEIQNLRMDVVDKRRLITDYEKRIGSLKTHHQKELEAKGLEFESQREELDALKRANAGLLENLSQLRAPQDGSIKQKKLRRSSTPTPPRALHRNGRKGCSPGWTEELSEFF